MATKVKRIISAVWETDRVYDGWQSGYVKLTFENEYGSTQQTQYGFKIGNGAFNTFMHNCHTPEDCIRWAIDFAMKNGVV